MLSRGGYDALIGFWTSVAGSPVLSKPLLSSLKQAMTGYEDKIFIKYIQIVMMCKFYNIKIENIKNNFELIESQIINIDDIVKNYDLHFSNIKEIDNSIKGILNYNLRSFLDI